MSSRVEKQKDSEANQTIDSLLDDLGGCGMFQVAIMFFVAGSLVGPCWTLMILPFIAYNPGWICGDALLNDTNFTQDSLHLQDVSAYHTEINMSLSCIDYSECKNVIFSEDASTIVTEWNLACDNFHIVSSIMSIETGGILLGTIISGISCDVFGRKFTHYAALSVHAFLNLVAMFSVNWEMFVVMSFFIGSSSGTLFMTSYIYPIEFIPRKWRSVASGIPIWSVGSIVLNIFIMLIRDWKLLYLLTAILSALSVIPVFWVPETLRWFAVNSKIEKAHRVSQVIAKLNKKVVPGMEMIDIIAEEERKRKEVEPIMKHVDLYGLGFLKRTVITSWLSLTNAIVYFIIFFGIGSLSGDFYINIILLSVLTLLPPQIAGFLASAGRKLCCMCSYVLVFFSCIIMIGFEIWYVNINKGLAILILSFFIVVLIDAVWRIVDLYTVELYPTPLRSKAMSHAISVGRIGGIIAPFIIPVDNSTRLIPNIIMAVVVLIAIVFLCLSPETKKRHMEDCIKNTDNRNRSSNYQHDMLTEIDNFA